MNRITFALAFVLLLAFNQASSQEFNWDAYDDYRKGYEAYKAGDIATALKWYQLSAEQGDAQAQYNLGAMYARGDGVLKNYNEAVKLYQLAAEQGHATAQSNIGYMYQHGNGVLKDNVTAHMWYNISSANGHEDAGEWRDKVAASMTPEAIEKATAMAIECIASDYKKCGY